MRLMFCMHAHELKLYFPKMNTEYRIWSCLSQTYWNQNARTTGQGKQSNRI